MYQDILKRKMVEETKEIRHQFKMGNNETRLTSYCRNSIGKKVMDKQEEMDNRRHTEDNGGKVKVKKFCHSRRSSEVRSINNVTNRKSKEANTK